MRLLWVVNTVMPPMAKAIGSRNVVFGGWVYEMIKRLSIDNDFSIGVVTVQSKQLDTLHKNIDGVDYFVLPAKKWNRHDVYQKYVDSVLEQFRPDHIHSEGTENRFSYRFIKSFNGSKSCSIQGLINANYVYHTGLLNFFHTRDFRDWIFYLLVLLDKRLRLRRRLIWERLCIEEVQTVFGRTNWDQAWTVYLNDKAKYVFCPRTLREEFYTQFHTNKRAEQTFFFGNASSQRKGIHVVVHAIANLKNDFPDIKLKVAGPSPYARNGSISKYHFGYFGYLRRLIARLDVKENIVFTGILSADEMVEELSTSTAFILGSIMENSPNTLGEAMILETPCIVSVCGGTLDMAVKDVEALFYRSTDHILLAHHIRSILEDKNLRYRLGKNARLRASITHDPEGNYFKLHSAFMYIKEQISR